MTLTIQNIIGIVALLGTAGGFAVWCGVLKQKVNTNTKEIEDNKKESEKTLSETKQELKDTRKELLHVIDTKLASTEKLDQRMDEFKDELKEYVHTQIEHSQQIKTNQEQTKELSSKVANLEDKMTEIRQEQALQGQSLNTLVKLVSTHVEKEEVRDDMLARVLAEVSKKKD
jgi:septal ring factor EnvC (AmiA/AmiB activator)